MAMAMNLSEHLRERYHLAGVGKAERFRGPLLYTHSVGYAFTSQGRAEEANYENAACY